MGERTHRTWFGPPELELETKFGRIGIWLSYRDQFWLQGIGEGTYGAPSKTYGKLRIGSSCIDVFAYIDRDPSGRCTIDRVWGNRYFAPRDSWSTHSCDRLTRHQAATLAQQLTEIVAPAIASTPHEVIEACHRRSIEADIRDERSAMETDLRAVRAAVANAQAHYDTIRELERSIGLPASPVPAHLAPTDHDVDAALDDLDRVAAIGAPNLKALRGAA